MREVDEAQRRRAAQEDLALSQMHHGRPSMQSEVTVTNAMDSKGAGGESAVETRHQEVANPPTTS